MESKKSQNRDSKSPKIETPIAKLISKNQKVEYLKNPETEKSKSQKIEKLKSGDFEISKDAKSKKSKI